MAASGTFGRPDGLHFQCRFERDSLQGSPDPGRDFPGLKPKSDCKNQLNWNMLMMIANTLDP